MSGPIPVWDTEAGAGAGEGGAAGGGARAGAASGDGGAGGGNGMGGAAGGGDGRGASLTWLLEGIAQVPPTDARVADLTLSHAEVRPGSLFFALGGRRTHGLEFAVEAAARGASVVLWEPLEAAGGADAVLAEELSGCPQVFAARVPHLRGLLGRIADRFFGQPSAQLRVTGFTGTNGKTTSAYLLAQCLERLRCQAAYMGTLGWGHIARLVQPDHTTPDVITVHRRLAALRSAGVSEVAMEVSSHALDQGRVDAVRFHAAAFTNLTRDHLDYHPDMQAYGAAKARLFAMPGLGHAVINVGDAFGRGLAAACVGRVALTTVSVADLPGAAVEGGHGSVRTLRAAQVSMDWRGISMELDGDYGRDRLRIKLLGRFNAENALLVLGCLLALGFELRAAAAVLAECVAPPGRMEVVTVGAAGSAAAVEAAPAGGKPLAVIDYAHTPDALDKALTALREHCRGALWCVFGCGGDRDAGKRALMGAVADAKADHIIVTDDNPRSENPAAITRAIAAGIQLHEARVINDRATAIATALHEAAALDVVLIAGKGHEDHQIYGAERRAFSDRREAQRCLEVA